MEIQPRLVRPGEGTAQRFQPGEDFTWKITAATSGGAMDFGELSVAPDVAVPRHIHREHDEAYYILDGTFRFEVGDEVADAPPGAFVFIPRGTPHAWSKPGGGVGRVAVIFTPGGMSGYFEELAPYLPELMAGLPDMRTVDPATIERATAIMQRYHYELVGPPQR
jgi:quercetin dioxygenase-like cupin family protein